jgi:hypothetical protein
MHDEFTTIFSFSILLLAVGAVEIGIVSLSPEAVALVLAIASLFPLLSSRMHGKDGLYVVSLAVVVLLAVTTFAPETNLSIPLLVACLLLHALLVQKTPSLGAKEETIDAMLFAFLAVGMGGFSLLSDQNPLLMKARGIFLLFVLLLGTVTLTIPKTMTERQCSPFLRIVVLLLSFWYLKSPWVIIGYAAGSFLEKRIAPWWGFLSIVALFLLRLSSFSAIPYGFFLALFPVPSLWGNLILSLLPLISSDERMLFIACILSASGMIRTLRLSSHQAS